MKDDLFLAQANALTQARYDYSIVEKRAIYFIINEVRKQFVEASGQRNLFDDLVLNLSHESLQASDSTLRDVYKALRSLRKKDIFIEDDEKALCVGYINYFEHRKRVPSVEVQVSKKILPYLVELASHFTTYNLTVAISLKTKYAQRFYEFCSQYKKQKFFKMTIEELRHKFMIEDKYPRYKLLKDYVLEPAYRELKELYDKGQCDLYFNYSENKSGRSVLGLNFTVVTREEVEQQNILKPEDHIYYIRLWLTDWLNAAKRPRNKAWIEEVISAIQLYPKKAKSLHERLYKMQKSNDSQSYAALARHIVEEDYMEGIRKEKEAWEARKKEIQDEANRVMISKASGKKT